MQPGRLNAAPEDQEGGGTRSAWLGNTDTVHTTCHPDRALAHQVPKSTDSRSPLKPKYRTGTGKGEDLQMRALLCHCRTHLEASDDPALGELVREREHHALRPTEEQLWKASSKPPGKTTQPCLGRTWARYPWRPNSSGAPEQRTIHQSAWKGPSENFASTAFSNVQLKGFASRSHLGEGAPHSASERYRTGTRLDARLHVATLAFPNAGRDAGLMLALICAGGLVAGSAYGGVPSVVRCPCTVIISGIVATPQTGELRNTRSTS